MIFSHKATGLSHQHWIEQVLCKKNGGFNVGCTQAAEASHKTSMRLASQRVRHMRDNETTNKMREYLKHFILFENLSSIHESKKNSVRKTHTHTPRTQTQTQHETQGYIQSLSQTQSYKIRLRRSYYLPHPVVSHLTSIGRPSYPVCWCACPRECSVTAFVSLRSGERDKTLNRVNPSKLPH